MHRCFFSVVCFLLGLFVSTAHAQDAPKAEPGFDPQVLLEEAKSDLEAERYDDAIAKLLKIYNIYPSSKLLFNIAKTYEKKGDCHEALNFYLTAIDPDGAAEAEQVREPVFKVFETFECDAKIPENISNLERSLAGFEAQKPEGGLYAAILLPLGRMYTQTPRCTDARQLFAKATRLAPNTEISKIAINLMQELTCEASPIAAPDQPKTSGPTAPPPEEHVKEYIAYGLIGAGVLTLAGSAVLNFSNQSDVDTINGLADANDNQAFEDAGFANQGEFDTFKSDTESAQTWTTVLAVSGLALLGSGVVVYFLPESSEAQPSSTMRWTPWVDPTQGTVGIGGAVSWD